MDIEKLINLVFETNVYPKGTAYFFYNFFKNVYLQAIGYLYPWEIKNKIFPTKKTDDGGQVFETIVSNK